MITIRVLVADDHAIFRQGLRRVIDHAADIVVADEAKNGREVLERIAGDSQYDVLLLDLAMPSPSGIELIKRIREERPKLAILVLTVHDESELASRAIRAGADGYLTKDGEPDVLLEAIRTVARGGHVVAQAIAAKLLFEPVADQHAPHQRLSDREYQVFNQLARGATIGEIAEKLRISAKTVSTHKQRLLQKLGLRNETDLVRYAIRHGIVH